MHKRGKKYYHQSRVPVDLQELLGKKWINHTLKVTKPLDAERIQSRLFSQLQDLYNDLRVNPHPAHEARLKLASILGHKPPAPTQNIQMSEQVPVTLPVKPDKRKVYRLSALIEAYTAEREKKWKYRSKKEMPGIYKKICDDLGNPDITKITRDDVNRFINKMEESGKAEDTVKKYASALSTLLEHGRDTLGWTQTNPAKRAPVRWTERPKDTENDVFSNEELTKLFADLQANKPRHYADGHHERYWVPLLAAYTGARVNEICQLRLKDIHMDYPTPYISIEIPKKDKNKDKKKDIHPSGHEEFRIKNISSYRSLPIHNDLLTFGFGVYVQRLAYLGKTMLFPSLKLGPNGYSHYFVTRYTSNSKYSKRWYCLVLGNDCNKGNHNWRHTFINMLKQDQMKAMLNKVESEILNVLISEISGHSVQGEAMSRYGKKYFLQLLANVFNKHIRYGLVPEVIVSESKCFDSGGIECDEYDETGRAITTYTCGEIVYKTEHNEWDPPSPPPGSLERPDLHGYSQLHEAISDFFPEPAVSEFHFV